MQSNQPTVPCCCSGMHSQIRRFQRILKEPLLFPATLNIKDSLILYNFNEKLTKLSASVFQGVNVRPSQTDGQLVYEVRRASQSSLWAAKLSRDGQLCPGQGIQEVKSHTVFMAPSGSGDSLTWPSSSSRQTCRQSAVQKFFTRSATIQHPPHFQVTRGDYWLCFAYRDCTPHFSLPSKHTVMEVRISLCFFQRILREQFVCFLGCIFALIDQRYRQETQGKQDETSLQQRATRDVLAKPKATERKEKKDEHKHKEQPRSPKEYGINCNIGCNGTLICAHSLQRPVFK